MPIVLDDAVCIRVWDWSETSQTVSLFARQLGVVRGLAKGAKRDDARFSGGFELFTLGRAGVIQKHSDAMATLTSWDLTEVFPSVRAGLPAFYVSMAMLDLVHHMVRDHDPHPTLFDSLVLSARALGDRGASASALTRFLWSLLSESGYRPDLSRDIRTGGALQPGDAVMFDARLGGFTRWSGLSADEPWRTRPQTLETLRRIAISSDAADSSETVTRAGKLLAAYVREIAGSPIRSLQQAFEVLSG